MSRRSRLGSRLDWDQPLLPYDIVLLVASHADIPTLLSLTLTSRDLHDHCAKYILAHGVHLRRSDHVLSFIHFMRPGNRKRWPHLRILRFGGGYLKFDQSVAAELAQVIPRASHLESLDFDSAEAILSSDINLPLAFASLKAIKHVTVAHAARSTCRMLEAMHWPLESASLSQSQDFLSSNRFHPALLLKNSRSTLTSLSVTLWAPFRELSTPFIYPSLKKLRLGSMWTPPSAQLMVCYPKLEELDVSSMENAVGIFDDTRYASLQKLSEAHDRWSELLEYRGDLSGLYLLAVPCRIRKLSVKLTEEEGVLFDPVMEDARPLHLVLSVSVYPDLPTCLKTSLGKPHLSTTERLDLCLHTPIFPPPLSLREYMKSIIDGLVLPCLRELTFSIPSWVSERAVGELETGLGLYAFSRRLYENPGVSSLESVTYLIKMPDTGSQHKVVTRRKEAATEDAPT